MKKKILYITTLLPYPPDMGGKIKTLSTLKQLVKEAEIYLFSFVDKKEDLVYEKDLLQLGIKKCFTVVYPVIVEKHRTTQFFTLFQSFFTSKPYSVYKYYSKEMKIMISNFIKEKKINVFWVDHTIQTQYLPKHITCRKILETHNFKTDFFKAMFFSENKFFWKFFSFYDWVKFKFYEPGELKKFDMVYAISQKESKKITQYNKNVKLLYPLVDATSDMGNQNSKILFFVGLLTWYPNKQGITWFNREVFPELKKAFPQISFDIVGDYTSRWKLPLYDGIKFHGYVRDISDFWRESSIFIVPLWYGSGIRIKILEALAHGLPVVSTSMGADGLPDFIKKNLYIANNKNEFIRCIKKLLDRKILYQKVVNNNKISLTMFNKRNIGNL